MPSKIQLTLTQIGLLVGFAVQLIVMGQFVERIKGVGVANKEDIREIKRTTREAINNMRLEIRALRKPCPTSHTIDHFSETITQPRRIVQKRRSEHDDSCKGAFLC